MVDVFGGARNGKGTRGPRGPPGPKGTKGEPATIKNLCTWMPQSVIKHLQEDDETCCFLIEDLTKDVKKSGTNVTEWISRTSRKFNLTLIEGKTPAKIKEICTEPDCFYTLEFKKSGYESDDISLLNLLNPGDGGFICFTFRTTDEHMQTLLSNFQLARSSGYFDISVNSNEIWITIYSNELNEKTKKVVPIHHNCRNWTTFFLEYRTSKTNLQEYKYIINNDIKFSGNFNFPNFIENISGCSIGSRWDEPFQYFNGDLSSLEIYHVNNVKDDQTLPDCLRELVTKKQMQLVH